MGTAAFNPSEIFKQAQTIAIVGLSDNPSRPSFDIAQYLQKEGFRIIPVNPKAKEILGETCYPNLASIPIPVDIVNVFRKAEDCVAIAQEAVAIKAPCLWLQMGIVNDQAEHIAKAHGLQVVMDRCIKVDHRKYKLSS